MNSNPHSSRRLIAPLVDVTLADDIKYKGFDTGVAGVSLDRFLVSVIGRKDKTVDDDGAVEDLCHPVVVGVYRFTDTLRGLAATLRGSRCGLSAAKTTGATFIDNKPDHFWKYVPIHELGHTFGLCHVDGLDRIMVPGGEAGRDRMTAPDLSDLSAADAEATRARIAELEGACGCGLGAAVAVAVYVALLSLGLDGRAPVEIGAGAAGFVAGAAAGKALGRLRALRERDRLLAVIAAAAARQPRTAR